MSDYTLAVNPSSLRMWIPSNPNLTVGDLLAAHERFVGPNRELDATRSDFNAVLFAANPQVQEAFQVQLDRNIAAAHEAAQAAHRERREFTTIETEQEEIPLEEMIPIEIEEPPLEITPTFLSRDDIDNSNRFDEIRNPRNNNIEQIIPRRDRKNNTEEIIPRLERRNVDSPYSVGIRNDRIDINRFSIFDSLSFNSPALSPQNPVARPEALNIDRLLELDISFMPEDRRSEAADLIVRILQIQDISSPSPTEANDIRRLISLISPNNNNTPRVI